MKRLLAIKRLLLALVILLILASGLCFLRSGDKTAIGHTVTFSDGSTMTLRAVTYGTENRYPGETAWARFLALLPNKLTRKYLGNKNLMTSTSPQVVLWFAHRGPGPAGDPQMILCDANGFETGGGYTMMRLGATGNLIEGWAFPYWPRRDPMFKLRIYERGQRYPEAKLAGEFAVRNPTPGSYPAWTPTPLPAIARAGDLTVTLFDLTAGVGQGSNRWKPAANATVSETRAGFHLEQNGQATKDWEIASVTASDASGNLIREIRGTGEDDDALYAGLRPHLWPAESAWKLRVGFSRKANFEAADLWTLRVPVPDNSFTNRPATRTNLHGGMLEYTGPARRSFLDGEHHLNFRITPRLDDYALSLVKALDDTGQKPKLVTYFTGRDEWAFAFQTSSNATSLELTLALHQTRYVEFLVPPRIISTNDPPRPARKKSR